MINKKSLVGMVVASMAVLSVGAYAAAPGAYVGAQAGWGDIHQDGFSGGSTSGNPGLAGRVFGGYQLNDFFAMEMGYTRFHNMKSNLALPGGNLSATLKAQAFDFVGKGILPLANKFSVYGKLGVAYLMENVSVSGSEFGMNIAGKGDANNLLPTFGLGVAYDITPNVVTDLGWNHIQKLGTTDLTNTDFVGVGLSYNFG